MFDNNANMSAFVRALVASAMILAALIALLVLRILVVGFINVVVLRDRRSTHPERPTVVQEPVLSPAERLQRLEEALECRKLTAEDLARLGKQPDSCCSICLHEFAPGDSVLQAQCDHTFHTDCLKAWVERSSGGDCPNCRSRLLTIEEVSNV